MRTGKSAIGKKLVATAAFAATAFVSLFPAGCAPVEETAEQEAFGIVANYDKELETKQNAVISAPKGTYITDHESTSENTWLDGFRQRKRRGRGVYSNKDTRI